ncbi:hypothetical protein B4121_4508 [Bacillus paralicheniformis]|uniref:Uncharacterized protein n=1 Tax=Bacillus paralicheniformis TaxID=1648923 RepID=A0A7Z0WT74_9BACI|nr:hypothetical protein B4121_4508 [Bacillus paralicheniformis]
MRTQVFNFYTDDEKFQLICIQALFSSCLYSLLKMEVIIDHEQHNIGAT